MCVCVWWKKGVLVPWCTWVRCPEHSTHKEREVLASPHPAQHTCQHSLCLELQVTTYAECLPGTLEHSACAPHPFGSSRVEQSRRFLKPYSFINFWPPAITLLNLVVRLRGTFGVKRGNPLKVQSRRVKIHGAMSVAVE